MGKKVLIGCEQSGTVREAFLARGFDAWSCDILPDARGSNRHMQGDIREVLANPSVYGHFDLFALFHPPCQRLCASGARWLTKPPINPPSTCIGNEAERWPHMSEQEQLDLMWEHLRRGAQLFSDCLNSYPHHIACENPVMHGHAKKLINFNGAKPHYRQPWHFGNDPDGPDNEKKRTGFWTRNLPELVPTGTLDGKTARNSIHHASPGKDRGKVRSVFFPGMASAIASQWGDFINAT